ncbi:hypothetical protein KKB64_05335 [Patescibacteria group bacterium]|nr:hypothetical protein [Patescibacteria group bacterium]MBU1473173.1 hypothetical protein [Patescibacteria group bacterium]MBU2457377.1 hypothetical protein [Planctomycetota bacterium]MBU2544289.1 hypothetical protein [Patescibacteria group bacterium]
MNWYFSSGDLDFFWKEQIQHLSWLPNIYRTDVGFGWSGIISLWLDYPFRLVLKLLSTIGLSWFLIEKILWVSVFIIAVYSSYHLAKYILQSRLISWLASLIYSTNTYFLLLFSGGQLGVAFAYAFAPFVLLKFIESRNKEQRTKNKELITNGLWLAVLIIFDLRLACLLLGAIVLYQMCTKTFYFFKIGVSLFVAALIHSFWILPTILTHANPSQVGEDFTNPGMLRFLSFADFSHTISLLHPNWPENLFGKIYFLQPEFLVLPILAFGSLLFVSRNHEPGTKNHHLILFFALLALIGAFFAKGVNSPAGSIFQWCFTYVPGFVMFRDPTKFYLFIAIGYSILIPFTLSKIGHVFQKRKIYVYVLFGIFWIITIRSVNFHLTQLPQEYVVLKDQLVQDTIPSRTLWIPNKENFAYYSDIHPIVTSTAAASIDSSIKYIIVPVDVNRRIFLNDYKYDSIIRNNIIEELSNKGLLRDERFQNLAVFKNPQFQEMKITVPDIVETQQYYANVGVVISAVALVVVLILTLWL